MGAVFDAAASGKDRVEQRGINLEARLEQRPGLQGGDLVAVEGGAVEQDVAQAEAGGPAVRPDLESFRLEPLGGAAEVGPPSA